MADLTPLDEKLGEVLGLAQAAQAATEKVSAMEDADDFANDLERMHEQAAETERRTDKLIDGLDGKKTAIRDKATDTKSEATEMMRTYLGGEDEALDGFEFLEHGRGRRALPLGDRRADVRRHRRRRRPRPRHLGRRGAARTRRDRPPRIADARRGRRRVPDPAGAGIEREPTQRQDEVTTCPHAV